VVKNIQNKAMMQIKRFSIFLIVYTVIIYIFAPTVLCKSSVLLPSVLSNLWQQKQPLSLAKIEALVKVPTPDKAIAVEIRRRGIDFEPDASTLEKLRKMGAGPRTISALQDNNNRKQAELQPSIISRKTVVTVANFKSLDDQNHAVTETILDQLRDSTKEYDDIQIQALGESITAQQGSEVARMKGRQNKAGIILWGWYSTTKEKVIINIHFEILQRPNQMLLRQEKQTLILPLAELESFSIQMRLSGEMTYLTLLTIGLTRLEVEDYDSAIDHFSTALAQSAVPENMIDPDNIYFYRGYAYYCKSYLFSEDELDNAVKDLDKAIELNARKIKARLIRALIYFQRKEMEKVISDCDQIITYEPENAFPYLLRGLAYSIKGDHSRADNDYNKATQLSECDCPNGFIYYIRGMVSLAKGNFDQAIANMDQAIASVDQDIKSNTFQAGFLPVLFFIRGGTYAAKSNYQQAYADFNRALSLNPKLAWAYWGRGKIHHDKEEYDRAIVENSIAIGLNPNFAEAYEARGDAYRHKGDYNKAIVDLDRAIELNSNNAILYYYRGLVCERKGELDQAIASLSQYILFENKDEDGYYYRAFVYERKGDLDKAISDYDQVIKLKPDYSYAYYYRGCIYQRKGNIDQAITDLTQCIKLTPDYAPAFLQRGMAYANKDNTKAISDLKMAIQLATDPQVRQQAEQKLQQLGVK
jgi:tetratricopeptide (TPR) repeat protein